MSLHDWTRVDAGTFHDFHQAWITHLKESLNGGILPPDYYAMGEQIAGGREPDVLTLHTSSHLPGAAAGVAVAETAPRVRLHFRPDAAGIYHRKARSLVIRHVSGHQVVALIEIISPANKDRAAHVADVTTKVRRFLDAGVHVLLVDLLPAGKHDPVGIHGAIWEHYGQTSYAPPPDGPLTLASYECTPIGPEAYVEPVAVGQVLVDMPLFLQPEHYVNVPLGPTYDAAFRGMPRFWKDVLERADS